MCLLAVFAWGETVITFIPGQTVGKQATVSTEDEMSLDGITLHTSYGAFAAAQYRFGKGATTTFTSAIGDIVKIEFTCTADNPASGFSEPAGMDDGIWEGSAETVTFVAGNKQVRATQIVVTVAESGLLKPKITPDGGTFYDPVQVTMTCGTSGAKIYYTTDGSNPTTGSKQYTAPFTLSTNTTVKAISAKDGEVSDPVEANFVFENAISVANIAGYLAAETGAVLRFTNPVNVLAQNKSYLYVQDNTGAALFYGDCGQTYKNGDVIPAGFVGTKDFYNGEPELKSLNGFNAASGNSPINPTEVGADQVGHDMFARFVKLSNVTISLNEDGKNYTLTDENGKTCAIYFGTMGVAVPSDLTANYDVEAIVGSYGKNDVVYQLLPTKVTKKYVPTPGDKGLGDLGSLPDDPDNPVTMGIDAVVLGQTGKYLYLKDDTGFGLVYGDCGKKYNQGDIIPAGYAGGKKTYDMEPELSDPLSGFQDAKGNIGEPTPEPIATLQAVNHDNWGKYVSIKVKVNTSDKTFLDESGNTIGYYDRFGCAFPSAEDGFVEVHAIVASFKTNYQLLPYRFVIEIKPVPVNSITELYNTPEGTFGEFTTRLTAVYQHANYLYVKDVEGKVSLVYQNGGLTNKFVNGDYIEGAIASWKKYNNYPQMTPVDDTFVKAGHGAAVKPVTKVFEDVLQNDVHAYLAFDGVQIVATDDAKKFMMTDENGDEMILFNQFGYEMPVLDPTKTYDVEGFLSIYKEEREIFPIKVKVHGGWLKGDVNGDGSVNIADVNLLINIILGATMDADTMKRADVNEDGSINISDINEVISIILK